MITEPQQNQQQTEQPPAPIAAPGVRPSKREREAAKASGVDSPNRPGFSAPDAPVKPAKAAEAPADPPADPPAGDPPAGDPPAGDPPAGDPPATIPLKDFAEKYGIDPAELYTMEINVNGEVVTLGAMKDNYKDYLAKAPRLEQLEKDEAQYIEQRGELIRDVDGLLQAIPPQFLTQEFKQIAAEKMRGVYAKEMSKLQDIYPAWRDPAVFQGAVRNMIQVAGQFGLTPGEVGSIYDHRWIQALNELARLKGLHSQAATLQKDSSHIGKAPSKSPAGSPPKKKAGGKVGAHDRRGQAAAVAALFSR